MILLNTGYLRVVKFIETESGIMVARSRVTGGELVFEIGNVFQLCKMKKFWR